LPVLCVALDLSIRVSKRYPPGVQFMRKIILAALSLSFVFCNAVSAATYSLVNDGSGVSDVELNRGLVPIYSWDATLNVNASGSSSLAGRFVAFDGDTYQVNINLLDSYFSNGNQYWGSFNGTVSGVTNLRYQLSLFDESSARSLQTDAAFGINVATANNRLTGGNDPVLEFSLFSLGPHLPGAVIIGSVPNFVINTHLTCASGPALADGSCPAASVPLPGTLALTGLALLGLAARRKRT
jgi:hypothetical protein